MTGSQPKTRGVTRRTRVAHHEAGHAVLSAVINDAPHHVSIVRGPYSLGRSRYQMEASPERLVQVHLAGFAAEELLLGRCSRQFRGPELHLAITAAVGPTLADISRYVDGSDQALAVGCLLEMGVAPTRLALVSEVNRFYSIAKEALASVWPAVAAVARVLRKRSALDREGFVAALRGHEIYAPVFSVQKAYGLNRQT